MPDTLLARAMRLVFRDPVRPLEILFLVALWSWAQFLAREPQLLSLPQYSSLAVLPASFWAVLMCAIGIVQLFAMVRDGPGGVTQRFVAMALSSGIWTVVAIGFWTSPIVAFGAPIYSAFAFLAALAGIWLGGHRRQVRG